MSCDGFPLARSTVDRDGVARVDDRLLRRLWQEGAAEVVLVCRDLVAVDAAGRSLDLVPPCALPDPSVVSGDPAASGEPAGAVELAYLGRDERTAYLALTWRPAPGDDGAVDDGAADDGVGDAVPGDVVPGDGELPDPAAALSGRRWASLREVGASLGDRDAGLATTAVALTAWHAGHARCPRCGAATEVVHAGWARRCLTDGTLHHPRTDPAVIVAATDPEDRLLLAHAAHWPQRRFSLVAGYVEPGESVEAAARREVAEECGLRIDDLDYRGSQPWPFPASLMVAFRARVTGGVAIVVDGDEVTEALFVTRAELAVHVAEGTVLLPSRSSIARGLIEEWFGAALPGA